MVSSFMSLWDFCGVDIHVYLCIYMCFFWFPLALFLLFDILFYLIQIRFCCDFVISLFYLIMFYYHLETFSFLIGDGKQVNPNWRSCEELRGVVGGETIITMCGLKKICQ